MWAQRGASQYFLQVQGQFGSKPPAFEALVNYGDWFRATVDLFDIDPQNPTVGHFAVAFDNLTTGVPVVPHAGDSTSATWWAGAVSAVNVVQLESPGNGLAQFDNITFAGGAHQLSVTVQTNAAAA